LPKMRKNKKKVVLNFMKIVQVFI